jgi:hypothetical protein
LQMRARFSGASIIITTARGGQKLQRRVIGQGIGFHSAGSYPGSIDQG